MGHFSWNISNLYHVSSKTGNGLGSNRGFHSGENAAMRLYCDTKIAAPLASFPIFE